MKDDLLSRATVVRDRSVAAIFCNPKLRRIALTFAAAPKCLSEVSAYLGIDLKRLHYYVTRLCRLGLLEIVEIRPRSGRPIKFYQTRGKAFFVPDEIAPESFSEAAVRELRQLIAHHRRRSRGMLFTVGPDGAPEARVILDQDATPDLLEIWQVLPLRKDQAQALASELKAMLKRYETSAAPGSCTYLVHAALARRQGKPATRL